MLVIFIGMQVRQAHNENNQNIAANLFNDPLRHIDYNQLIAKQKNEAAIVIDVREPQELAETGTIPNSIHIPCKFYNLNFGVLIIKLFLVGGVSQALELAPEDFRKKYGAEKPSKEALIVFSCRSGNRSKDALFKALLLGYEKYDRWIWWS